MSVLADLLDPPPVDVFSVLGYVPTERQAVFHAATEFDVLYGGAASGGKTLALLMDDLRDCIQHPGIRVGAFRRTFGELEESLLAELANYGFATALGCTWNGSKYNLHFPNGSVIMYRYAESLQDATRRQGGQYQKLTFDERNLTSPDVISFLESRLRSGRADIPVIGVRSGTNPGGPGHGVAKKKYVDKTSHGAKVYTDDRGRTIRFVQAKMADNPHVNAEYASDLDQLPEAQRAAFKDGNWDTFKGQYFAEWNFDRHVVKPFTPPDIWSKYTGIDFGFAAPWAVIWGARDGDSRLWIYREFYEPQVGQTEQARRILEAEEPNREWGVTRWADPSMWSKRDESPAPATAYLEAGVAIMKATNDRVPGWSLLRHYLGEMPACEIHRAAGWKTCPRLHVFSTCTNLIFELPNLVYDLIKVEDCVKVRDHASDALRYLIMGIGGTAKPIDVDSWTAPKTRWDTDVRAHSTPWESGSLLTAEF
jgi:hypothetical protein